MIGCRTIKRREGPNRSISPLPSLNSAQLGKQKFTQPGDNGGLFPDEGEEARAVAGVEGINIHYPADLKLPNDYPSTGK